MNWTHVVMVTEKFISIASSTAFLSGLANFPDLGIENFNTTGTNLMEALQNAWKLDVDKYDHISFWK
ncbi:hypothetical protein DPMN_036641 [Dreissena polymorpha]|uniref:Uncharacterized protein n=1 Tax=Dreissena polymorpha TaxID=45954 RepID=A0A9D4RLM7_DREPO|nr:hypothetical protein DPMN_036641 [Dreissena polymorpha]